MNATTTSDPARARPGSGSLFLREAAANVHATGAVLPSSARLAAALVSSVRSTGGRSTVLEVGGGTGSVTRALVHRLGPADRLDVIEANPRFTAYLRRSLPPSGTAGRPDVTVHGTHIESFTSTVTYDSIVSGLPFANFEPELVTAITDRYEDLLAPGGTITYFSYRGTRTARSATSTRSARRRHAAVDRVLEDFRRRFDADSRTVWANVPPARVWTLRATNGVRA